MVREYVDIIWKFKGRYSWIYSQMGFNIAKSASLQLSGLITEIFQLLLLRLVV